MSENISRIPHVGPTYPVKPVQRSQKDRAPGERHKKEPGAPNADELHEDDKPTIDEHV